MARKRSKTVVLLLGYDSSDFDDTDLKRIGEAIKGTPPLPKKRKRRRHEPGIGDRFGSYEELVGQNNDPDS